MNYGRRLYDQFNITMARNHLFEPGAALWSQILFLGEVHYYGRICFGFILSLLHKLIILIAALPT